MGKGMRGLFIFLPVMAAGGMLSYLYCLKLPCLLIVAFAFIMAFPIVKRERQIRFWQEQRFVDANIYMEQMLYSFRKNPKILTSLEDVERLFSAGAMKDRIQNAISYIRDTYGEGQVLEKALFMIEEEYPAQRIGYVHRLMLKTERLGGDCAASVRILLKDRDVWEKETVSYKKRCQFQRRNILAAIILSCLLCLMTPILSQGSLQKVSVTDHVIYQITTVVMLLSGLCLYLVTEHYFTRDWLAKKSYADKKSSMRRYEKVTEYDIAKGRKKSIKMACPFAVLSLICFVFGHIGVGICLSALSVLLLFQHRMDYALAKKSVLHEIRKAFPDWLMEVSLLLQTENVANSIHKSVESAPDILKPELYLLVERLEQMPESNIPYTKFLQEFSIPEVSSAMGMLYSLSDGSGSDASVQMEEILSRNAQWMSESEAMSNQDKVAGMYLLFLIPALLGALKMIVDMTLILFAFFLQVRV